MVNDCKNNSHLLTNVKIINESDWIKADQNPEFDHSNSRSEGENRIRSFKFCTKWISSSMVARVKQVRRYRPSTKKMSVNKSNRKSKSTKTSKESVGNLN